MTSVSVVVPYRGDNGGPRDQAWDYVQRWWQREHPDWQLVSGHLLPEEPWVKALAVADGLRDATGDMLVIADADAICPGVGLAVDAVVNGSPRWAIPHFRVHRLTEKVTAAVLRGSPLPPDPGPRGTPRGKVVESHVGAQGGGMVVLPRELYDRVPLDPRFISWGQEDLAWGIALEAIGHKPARAAAPLWHLWHPPPRRIKAKDADNAGGPTRLTRTIGSHESLALYERYRRANGSPELIGTLLAEIQGSRSLERMNASSAELSE